MSVVATNVRSRHPLAEVGIISWLGNVVKVIMGISKRQQSHDDAFVGLIEQFEKSAVVTVLKKSGIAIVAAVSI